MLERLEWARGRVEAAFAAGADPSDTEEPSEQPGR